MITAIEINGTRYTPYDIGECADCVQCDMYESCQENKQMSYICDLILNDREVWNEDKRRMARHCRL